jgi:DNA-binding SARP family transcriptional activator
VHYARAMRFLVLGPLEVEADNGPVVLGGQKERLLLAQLLTRPNQVVPVEALVRGLWGEQPPPTAAKTLQSHVVRLRRALEPARARGAAGAVLVTREPGYVLRVPPGMLDAARFEEQAAAGRRALADGSVELAGSLLREALGLWRGRAFEEFLDADFGAAESDRLAELRLVALEDRLETDLRLGRHRELAAELEGLLRDHPLRERLWAQLLLALYRSGRQADALLAYQRARSILVEELGIDPGAELRRLHAAILAQDPALDLKVSGAAGPAQELPEALEPVGSPFVGRTAELTWLRAAWTRAAQGEGGAVLVAGAEGMGKTRLAAGLAREIRYQGGLGLYGRCAPGAFDPLQPFGHALASVGASLPDLGAPGPGRSPAALGQRLADLLVGRSDRAVLLVLDDLQLAQAPALEALAGLAAAAVTRRLLVLGAYREEAVTPGLAALVERLDRGGAAHRRLGPLGREEVAQLLNLYESEPAAQATAGTVLEATGGVPLRVHQAGALAQAQAARQGEQVVRQTASSPSHLRLVQAKPADDVVDLPEPGGWRRVVPARLRQPGWRLAVAGFAVAVLVSTAFVADRIADRGSGVAAIAANSLGLIDLNSDALVGQVPLGVRSGQVAAGEGAADHGRPGTSRRGRRRRGGLGGQQRRQVGVVDQPDDQHRGQDRPGGQRPDRDRPGGGGGVGGQQPGQLGVADRRRHRQGRGQDRCRRDPERRRGRAGRGLGEQRQRRDGVADQPELEHGRPPDPGRERPRGHRRRGRRGLGGQRRGRHRLPDRPGPRCRGGRRRGG